MFTLYKYQSKSLNPSHKYILPVLKNLLNKYHSKSILDLGCGNGSVMKELTGIGYSCFGIEASDDGFNFATQNVGDNFVVQGDITCLPALGLDFSNWDTFVCVEVIAHLYDPVAFMTSLNDIVTRNQVVILTYPYHGYLKNLVIAITGKFDSHVRPLWRGGYVKFFSRRTFSALCKQTGFEIQSYHRVGRIPLLWKTEIVVLKKER